MQYYTHPTHASWHAYNMHKATKAAKRARLLQVLKLAPLYSITTPLAFAAGWYALATSLQAIALAV